MITGYETAAKYFMLFATLGSLAGLSQDDMIEMVMGILRDPPADQIRTYRVWIAEIVQALGQPPTGPEGAG